MTTPRRPRILPVKVEVALELWALRRFDPELEAKAVEASLGGLLDSLGIVATPSVRFEAGAPPEGLSVFVHGTPIGYARDLVDRLYRTRFGRGAGDIGDDGQLIPRLWDRVFRDRHADPDADRHRLAAFIAESLVEILKTAPSRLVGPAGLEVAAVSVPSSHVDPEREARVVRVLLDHAIALTDRTRINAALVSGIAGGRTDDEIAEQLIARSQPGTLDIELHPRYAESLLGLDASYCEPVALEALEPGSEARQTFGLMRDGLFYDLGIRIPPIRFRVCPDLPERCFRLRMGALTYCPSPGLAEGQVLVGASSARLQGHLGVSSNAAINPGSGNANAIIQAADEATVSAAGYTCWSPLGYLILAVARDLRRRAGLFVHLDVVESELARLDEAFPELTRAVLNRWTSEEVTRVARTLVVAGVSIRNLRAILERLHSYDYVRSESSKRVLDERLWIDELLDPSLPEYRVDRAVEYVRIGLKQYMLKKYEAGGVLRAHLLDTEEIERPLVEELAFRQHVSGRPTSARHIVNRIRQFLQAEAATADATRVILAHNQVASLLRSELGREFPEFAFLSYQELPASAQIQPARRIGLN